MDRVLIIEDDEPLGAQLGAHVRAAGFEPVWWREGHHVRPEAPPEVAMVVLDLMLPRVDGFTILQELRAASDIPVLVLSARSDPADKVRALRLGADDYLTKPFWPEELIERIRARARRPTLQRGNILEVGALRLDPEHRRAWKDNVEVELTRVEFDFLHAMMRRPGVAITRGWLAANVLDPDRDGTERTLDVHASRLRKKLDGGFETVWGVGYRLGKPV